MRSVPRRRLSALLTAAAAFLGLAATGVLLSAPSAASTTAAGIVQRSSTQLVLDGSPYRFTGYQVGLGASPAHPLCSTYTDAQVTSTLQHARESSGANAVRVWMFQGYGGPQDWSRFDLIFSEARKAGVKVVATLTNQWGDCEPRKADGGLVVKHLPWYQSGYRSLDAGHALSYRDFVSAMATRYAAEPALLAWQLVNEAEAAQSNGVCDQAAGRTALRTFSDDIVGVVRAAGDPHLVGLGSMGSGQCGLSGSADFRYVHAGALDMCEYHDYTPTSAMPGDAWNGLAVRVGDCAAVGKPLFVGEAGIPAGIQANGSNGAVTSETLARRASLFDAKLTQQTAAGVAGFVVWQKAASNGDGFTVFDGDPVEAVLRKHAAGTPSPAPTSTATASPTASPTATATASPSPTATSSPKPVTMVQTLLKGTTGSRGSATVRLATGAGPLNLLVKPVTTLANVRVAVRNNAGTLLATTVDALPVTLGTTVSAGSQSITVTGPRHVRFVVLATHAAP